MTIISDKSSNNKKFMTCLQHHSQVQGLVDYKLCHQCFGGFYQGFAYLGVKKSNMTTSKIENQGHL